MYDTGGRRQGYMIGRLELTPRAGILCERMEFLV